MAIEYLVDVARSVAKMGVNGLESKALRCSELSPAVKARIAELKYGDGDGDFDWDDVKHFGHDVMETTSNVVETVGDVAESVWSGIVDFFS